jgi:serine/threonine-protein kinase
VRTLQDDGLSVTVKQDFSAAVAKGHVISSDPGPGSRIRKDSQVVLDVSKGADRPAVPDVAGKPQAEAQQAIIDAGLAVGRVSRSSDADVPQGAVIRTDPGPGAKEQPNTPVDLVVSAGPTPVDLPDVVGESIDQATQDLNDAGFKVQLSPDQVFSPAADAGQVAVMSPSGSQAVPGSTITLTVSKGQQQTDVPDVSGMTEKDARKTLEGAGFKVKVIKLNPFGTPTVHIESPNGGQAPIGSSVTITLF